MQTTEFGARFELEERIAQRPEGSVYRALDRQLGSHVALTVVEPSISADSTMREALLKGVRGASSIRSEGALRPLDVHREGERLAISSALPEGSSLRALIAGSMPPQEVAGVIGRTAGVLADAGVVHGTLLPESVWVGLDGTVQVADFGRAALAGALDRHRGDGAPALAPYQAPELRSSGRPTAASDVYALGMTAYEGLGGEPTTGRVDDAANLQAGVPKALARAVDGALASSPADRLASPAAVADALGAGRGATAGAGFGKVATLVAASVLVLGAAGVFLFGGGGGSEEALEVEELSEEAAQTLALTELARDANLPWLSGVVEQVIDQGEGTLEDRVQASLELVAQSAREQAYARKDEVTGQQDDLRQHVVSLETDVDGGQAEVHGADPASDEAPRMRRGLAASVSARNLALEILDTWEADVFASPAWAAAVQRLVSGDGQLAAGAFQEAVESYGRAETELAGLLDRMDALLQDRLRRTPQGTHGVDVDGEPEVYELPPGAISDLLDSAKGNGAIGATDVAADDVSGEIAMNPDGTFDVTVEGLGADVSLSGDWEYAEPDATGSGEEPIDGEDPEDEGWEDQVDAWSDGAPHGPELEGVEVGTELPEGITITLPGGVTVTLGDGLEVTLGSGTDVTLSGSVGGTISLGGVSIGVGVDATLEEGADAVAAGGEAVHLPAGTSVTVAAGTLASAAGGILAKLSGGVTAGGFLKLSVTVLDGVVIDIPFLAHVFCGAGAGGTIGIKGLGSLFEGAPPLVKGIFDAIAGKQASKVGPGSIASDAVPVEDPPIIVVGYDEPAAGAVVGAKGTSVKGFAGPPSTSGSMHLDGRRTPVVAGRFRGQMAAGESGRTWLAGAHAHSALSGGASLRAVDVDRTPPRMDLDTPGEEERLNPGDEVLVSGWVVDLHLDRVLINGDRVAYQDQGGRARFEKTIVIPPKKSVEIRIEAFDKAANRGLLLRSHDRAAHEVDPVEMVEPGDGELFPSQSVAVRGYVPQHVEGSRLAINGREVAVENGVFQTTIDVGRDGPHPIRATYEGRWIVSTSTTVTVDVDSTPPSIELTSPANEARIKKPAPYVMPIRGRVVDEHPDVVIVNGRSSSLGKGGRIRAHVELEEGWNDITIVAEDAAGHASRELTRRVFFEAEDVKVKPPTIDQPRPQSVHAPGRLLVRGRVHKAVEGSSVTVNGLPANLDGRRFEAWVDATEDGPYGIEAVHGGENVVEASRRIQVFIDASPPELTIYYPSEQTQVVRQTRIEIRGRVSDPSLKSLRVQVNGRPVRVSRQGIAFKARASLLNQQNNHILATATDRNGFEATEERVVYCDVPQTHAPGLQPGASHALQIGRETWWVRGGRVVDLDDVGRGLGGRRRGGGGWRRWTGGTAQQNATFRVLVPGSLQTSSPRAQVVANGRALRTGQGTFQFEHVWRQGDTSAVTVNYVVQDGSPRARETRTYRPPVGGRGPGTAGGGPQEPPKVNLQYLYEFQVGRPVYEQGFNKQGRLVWSPWTRGSSAPVGPRHLPGLQTLEPDAYRVRVSGTLRTSSPSARVRASGRVLRNGAGAFRFEHVWRGKPSPIKVDFDVVDAGRQQKREIRTYRGP